MEEPRDAVNVHVCEVKLGWNAQDRKWVVMLIVPTPERAITLAMTPEKAEEVAGTLVKGAQMARAEPPHLIGSAH